MAADPPGEARDVANARACARLAAGDMALDDERLESLRRRVDRRREPCRPRADDRHVVDLGAGARLAANRLDQVDIGRTDQDAAIVANRNGNLAAGLPDLVEQRGSLVRVGCVERVRHREPGEEVADLVGAPAVLRRNQPEEGESLAVGAGPAREELGHRGVEPEPPAPTAWRGGSRSGRASSP